MNRIDKNMPENLYTIIIYIIDWVVIYCGDMCSKQRFIFDLLANKIAMGTHSYLPIYVSYICIIFMIVKKGLVRFVCFHLAGSTIQSFTVRRLVESTLGLKHVWQRYLYYTYNWLYVSRKYVLLGPSTLEPYQYIFFIIEFKWKVTSDVLPIEGIRYVYRHIPNRKATVFLLNGIQRSTLAYGHNRNFNWSHYICCLWKNLHTLDINDSPLGS